MSKKTWDEFLRQLSVYTQVYVIGPMWKRASFTPLGPTIFVDGGTVARASMGAMDEGNIPLISVGDGDSAVGPLEVTLPKEKDYSDLAFVLRTLPPNIRQAELYGFLGGRLDHELANFGEAHDFLKRSQGFTGVRFEDKVIGFAGGPLRITISGEFSVLVFEEAKVSITGACKYPLPQPTLLKPLISHGLSNVGMGAVVIGSTGPCFLVL